MRINQLYCDFGIKTRTGFDGFREVAAKKFNLTPITFGHHSLSEPLLALGCYNHNQAWCIITHAKYSMVVLYWCGSDSMIIRNDKSGYWAKLMDSPNIKHIAPSHWIAEDLKAMGLTFIELPITLQIHEDIKPEPLGDSVYVYQPDKENYGSELYKKLKDEIPFPIIETTPHTYKRDELIEVYKRCFIGLRFTEHDGLAETVCEMGLMGRTVIHNGDTPNCVKYSKGNIPEILWDIKSTYENREFINDSGYYKLVAKETANYLNVNDDFLNTEFYGNKD